MFYSEVRIAEKVVTQGVKEVVYFGRAVIKVEGCDELINFIKVNGKPSEYSVFDYKENDTYGFYEAYNRTNDKNGEPFKEIGINELVDFLENLDLENLNPKSRRAIVPLLYLSKGFLEIKENLAFKRSFVAILDNGI